MASSTTEPHSLGKWIKRLIFLGLLGGGGYYAWTLYDAKTESETTYRTAEVTKGKLTQAVTATGQLNALIMVQVGSQISGTIEKIHVDFNSPVKAGQLIAELDAATYRAVTAQGEGEVANAQAGLELARLNAERKKELREKQLAPAADYDKAMADLKQAESALKIKSAVLDKSKVDLARCNIYAPIDGIVISRKIDVGQTVAASLNSPVLFEIANDLAKMQIHANVAEADVGGVEPGQMVDFTVDAFPDRTFQGKVQQVRNAPITVDNVVTYDTVIDVDNPDLKLKPGMTANVSIILAQRDDVLQVSNAALRFKPADEPGAEKKPEGDAPRGERTKGKKPTREAKPERTVYLLGPDAKATPVQVTVGITDSLRTEILTGLTEGQKVITGVTLPTTTSTPNPMGGSPFGGSRR